MNKKLYEDLLKRVDQRAGRRKPLRIAEEPAIDVKAIREKTGLSQTDFARLLNVSRGTLLNWEQGRRMPTGPARALLKAVARDPEHVLRALHSY